MITNFFQTKMGFSIDGHRLELTPRAFGGVLLSVDGQKRPEFKVTSKQPDYTLQLGEREVLIHCDKGRLAKVEVKSRGRELFPSAKHVTPVRAQPGSLCGAHPDREALIACVRCGTFACETCSAPDGTYCPNCFRRLSEESRAKAAALAYATPAIMFVIMFGLLGGLLGGGAAAVSYAVARRSSSRAVKLGVSILVYAIAGVVCVVAAAAVTAQRQQ
ncbi:MAG TPA: hypothetical protein VND93_15920 [Myxococcales bacterium]|nr:hypothetical protein [Myxococcales bacterium]